MNSLAMLLPFLFWVTSFHVTWGDAHEDFLHCLALYSSNDSSSISKVTYTPCNTSYSSVLQSRIGNIRFNTTETPKPVVIVTPTNVLQIQATIHCSQKHSLPIRIRSGGHDFEGLSYVSSTPPFVVIDLTNFRTVTVDVTSKSAWVQPGATLGEIYHGIGVKSRTLAFPAGICPTVGAGGHFSGGGYGLLLRKYGLAADNIIDAQLIDVNGRILNRASMGEDLFWAIRGGGGNTFGIVVAWKINLVPVPPVVTVFSVSRTLEQNAIKLFHRWQHVANMFPEDLMIQLMIRKDSSSQGGNSNTIMAFFNALFLGGVDKLLPLVKEGFPELGVMKEDCKEMSWMEAQISFASGFTGNLSTDILLTNASTFPHKFKGSIDYFTDPVPLAVIEEIWKRIGENVEVVWLVLTPYGGRMSEISESSIPYPHRAGILYQMGYIVGWDEGSAETSQRHINWFRRLYSYMTPFASKNPRRAYVNYRDLDIGTNLPGHTSYEKARIWGVKYFKNNFRKLVQVKTAVDPTNYFRNEQSIPPLSA
ncbi:hypothetical protein K2173_001807 [Erythroxylum novogranatense]|uniref:FAD-binding PCMH-type domain-containing protein n=1 Tax=Erythroxylum novogranatense TaxID=1862640 RepID=A0AAV8SIR0_9ROSI|nr:hypothetical protein K2173_001807 [Erythroxylum novogranatense]